MLGQWRLDNVDLYLQQYVHSTPHPLYQCDLSVSYIIKASVFAALTYSTYMCSELANVSQGLSVHIRWIY